MLRFFMNREDHDQFTGDLEEAYFDRRSESGGFRARLWLAGQIARTLPIHVFTSLYWSLVMIRNYLLVAFRSMKRNKVNALLNTSGLSVAVAFSLLVILFVKSELSYNLFHENGDRIFRLIRQSEPSETEPVMFARNSGSTPIVLAEDMLRVFPEIEYAVRITARSITISSVEDASLAREKGATNTGDLPSPSVGPFNESVHMVDNDFFRLFSFPIVYGNTENPLVDPNNVVISAEIAEKYFGTENAVDKTLLFDTGSGEYLTKTVSAVFDNMKDRSTREFGILLTYKIFRDRYDVGAGMLKYTANNPETFIKLRENASIEQFDEKLSRIDDFIDRNMDAKYYCEYRMQPISDIHLNRMYPGNYKAGSDPMNSYILGGLGMLVLVVACINFTTLSVGSSLNRAKEVGIRKVVGAQRKQIAGQHIGESMMTTALALLLGLILAAASLPYFSDLAGKDLSFAPDAALILTIIVLTMLTGLFGGSYPAMVLSRFAPARVLKGIKIVKGSSRLTKVLIVFQFALSIVLIISTLIMQNQFRHMTSMNLGFERERLIQVTAIGPHEDVNTLFNRYEEEVRNRPGILNTIKASTHYGGEWTELGYRLPDETPVWYGFNMVTHDVIETMGLELLDGRTFSRDMATDEKEAVLINEAAAGFFGTESPIGKPAHGFAEGENRVIGVIKDFNFASLHNEIQPLILALSRTPVQPGTKRLKGLNTMGWPPRYRTCYVRIGPGDPRPIMAMLNDTWQKLAPMTPSEISFVDDETQAFYREDLKWGRIINIAAMFAIGIACLGLFGLSVLSVEKRIREVGIRKVLGASVSGIMLLFSRELLVLVAVSNVLAWPAAYYIMNRWLQNFAYRIEPGIMYLAGAALLTSVLAFLTISFITIRAARSNPADVLRYE